MRSFLLECIFKNMCIIFYVLKYLEELVMLILMNNLNYSD